MELEGSDMAKKTVMCLLTGAEGTPLGYAMYIPHNVISSKEMCEKKLANKICIIGFHILANKHSII